MKLQCKFCNTKLTHKYLDLGYAPLTNSLLDKNDLNNGVLYYPLRVYVCSRCYLSQSQEFAGAGEIFKDNYPYFSSTSTSWVEHARKYSESIIDRFGLNQQSFVVEVASNDGYLLKNFRQKNIPCLGIEPTKSTADVCKKKYGIEVEQKFFNLATAIQLKTSRPKPNLIIANNVYAHIPDINDFTSAIAALLSENGVATLEFHHVKSLIEGSQFDTIYHEHYYYHSLYTVCKIFEFHNLKVFDVEKLLTHGGSLRVFVAHKNSNHLITGSVRKVIDEEILFGVNNLQAYHQFKNTVEKIKYQFLKFLIDQKNKNKVVCCYGAASKGCTFLNYIGASCELISVVFDASESKQGKFFPGNSIPICNPNLIREIKPDYLIVLPWNISNEIIEQNSYIKEWGGKFVIAIPNLKIF